MYRKDCCTAPAAAATVAEEKMVARVALAVVAMVTEKRTATAAKAAGTCVNLFRLSSAVPPPFTPSARSRQTDHGGKVWAFDQQSELRLVAAYADSHSSEVTWHVLLSNNFPWFRRSPASLGCAFM